jgi:NAD(P)H-hydrate epimerase
MAVPESEYGTAVPWEVMTLPLLSTDGVFSARAVQGVLDFVRARRVSAVAVGPGLSTKPGAARFALTLLESLTVPVVADADALNALSSSGLRPRRKAPWILTPHPGEAGRLLRSTSKAVQADRPAAAAALAARFGAVAVLKGARTIVTDGSTIYENSTGNPGMASGGMGDVLTGMIAALVGQVMASTPREACLRAAVLGVYLHGRAGDLALRELGPVGITASDLANRVPAALKEIL